jgi:hypothetical protein
MYILHDRYAKVCIRLAGLIACASQSVIPISPQPYNLTILFREPKEIAANSALRADDLVPRSAFNSPYCVLRCTVCTVKHAPQANRITPTQDSKTLARRHPRTMLF